MKIQCNVCEAAEATVLCCSDEAALCWACDEKVHSANKLAGKHQRVPISSSNSQMPKCDICQEQSGFFFCLQDRALLCCKCDISIHSANAYVSAHQRFLLTGVKVGAEPTNPGTSSFLANLSPTEKASESKFNSTLRRDASKASTVEYNEVLPGNGDRIANASTERVLSASAGGSIGGSFSSWQIDDFFGLTDMSQNLGYTDYGSSKAGSSKRGSSDSSSIMRSAELDMDDDERLGEVPTSSWSVPQISSPPTASGLHWPKDPWNRSDRAVSVPDICGSPRHSSHCQHCRTHTKRRRQL